MAVLSEVGTLLTAGMVAFGSVLSLITRLLRHFSGSTILNGSSVTVPFCRAVCDSDSSARFNRDTTSVGSDVTRVVFLPISRGSIP